MSCKKTRLAPGDKPDKEVQIKFAKRIKRTIKRTKKTKEIVIFLDPTHQVHNTINGYCWQEKGRAGTKTISSNSGRKRITILGAINAVSHKPTTLIIESNCDKEAMKLFLKEIRRDYPGGKKIYIFLDNARYSYNKEVAARAKELNIKLVFLPAYCPNLNLIERLWKFLKKKIRNGKYYQAFKEFKNAVYEFFKNFKQYKSELKTLLTLKFQII